jgi:hypothetical protein
MPSQRPSARQATVLPLYDELPRHDSVAFPLGVLLLPRLCCSVILTRPFVLTHLLALAIRPNQSLLYSSHSLPILPTRRGLAHRHILKHAAELAYRIVQSIDQFRQSGTSGTALASLYTCKRLLLPTRRFTAFA